MLYVRGHREDYDDWERAGCSGWSFGDVLPWFRRAEGNQRGASPLHGADGPLQVADQQTPRAISEDFVRAAVQSGVPFNDDFNGIEQEGAGLYQCHAVPWRREERRALLGRGRLPASGDDAPQPRGAHRHSQALPRGDRARPRRRRRGAPRRQRRAHPCAARGGAVRRRLPFAAAADALGHRRSRRSWQQHGIAVQQALPGRGAQPAGPHSTSSSPTSSKHTDLFGIGLGRRAVHLLPRRIFEWRRTGTGLIATPFAEGGAFIKSSPELRRPDLQLHFVIAITDDHARKLHAGYGFSCHVCVLRPKSRGECAAR